MPPNPIKEPHLLPTESVASTEALVATPEAFTDIFQEISDHELLAQIPEDEREEVLHDTFELYVAAKEIVAPVIVGFADDLLSHADGKQIIFAGRDGIGPFMAASLLKEKFDYPTSDNQLIYAYLTRRIVDNTPPDVLIDYLQQQGLKDPSADIVLADIGMYGTIISKMQRTLPHIETRYLISKNSTVPGYADNYSQPMSALESVIGNPAVHFMEDTFSGTITSPSELVDVDGTLTPNTADSSFPPKELLKRLYALKAIEDYTKSTTERPDSKDRTAVAKLNDFLADPSHFSHMMVPHARSY